MTKVVSLSDGVFDGFGDPDWVGAVDSVVPVPSQDGGLVDKGRGRGRADGLIPPHLRWTLHFANWMRVGVALFLVLSVLLGLGGCGANASASWQPASRVLPQRVLEQAIKDNATVEPAEAKALFDQALAWSVPGGQQRLVLINYNTPLLCGVGGCLYTGLIQDQSDKEKWKDVLSMRIKPEVPKGVRLVEGAKFSENYSFAPCLKVNQVEVAMLRTNTLCLQGDSYKMAASKLTPIVDKN